MASVWRTSGAETLSGSHVAMSEARTSAPVPKGVAQEVALHPVAGNGLCRSAWECQVLGGDVEGHHLLVGDADCRRLRGRSAQSAPLFDELKGGMTGAAKLNMLDPGV